MENEKKFHFSDFTYANYGRLLSLAREKYLFKTYTDFNKEENFVLWRHDVDFSVHSAYELAKIESENHVRATYFLHLHSEFYNLLEPEITLLVRKIIDLGHAVGIHFDPHFYDIRSEHEIEEYLTFEAAIMERIFKIKPQVFSFHNTNDFTMKCKEWQYAGLINVYAEYFKREVGYCSDSNGYWIYQRLEEVLQSGKHKRLQVLTHPAWWQREVMSPKQRIWKCIDDWASRKKHNYQQAMANANRLIVDW
ncbi:MAG: hypothetical protein KatS3mg031_1171 [Chitinophagales bacterium]|nr:MAG: hypothetical protein KatS3mg031_1171 [Chitinophagales bacterium]